MNVTNSTPQVCHVALTACCGSSYTMSKMAEEFFRVLLNANTPREVGQNRGSKLIRICVWCDKYMELKPGGGLNGVTHGICPDCSKRFIEDY